MRYIDRITWQGICHEVVLHTHTHTHFGCYPTDGKQEGVMSPSSLLHLSYFCHFIPSFSGRVQTDISAALLNAGFWFISIDALKVPMQSKSTQRHPAKKKRPTMPNANADFHATLAADDLMWGPPMGSLWKKEKNYRTWRIMQSFISVYLSITSLLIWSTHFFFQLYVLLSGLVVM